MSNEMTTKAMENLNKLAELNMKVLDKVTSRQKETMEFMMEQGKRQMKLATEAKTPKEFLEEQVKLAKETSERMLEQSNASIKAITEVQEEYRSFIQEGMTLLSEKVGKVTGS